MKYCIYSKKRPLGFIEYRGSDGIVGTLKMNLSSIYSNQMAMDIKNQLINLGFNLKSIKQGQHGKRKKSKKG